MRVTGMLNFYSSSALLAKQSDLLASRHACVSSPSVCPSVCRPCIASKQPRLGSEGLHWHIAPGL